MCWGREGLGVKGYEKETVIFCDTEDGYTALYLDFFKGMTKD